MKKRILYIGNALSGSNVTQTSIENLTELFRDQGYVVHTASRIRNKIFRMLDMLWKTLVHAPKTDVVLIDTYSTTNFWYAVLIAGLCKLLQKAYIPILHGGNLPDRLKNSPKSSRFLFKTALVNVAPSHYLLSEFNKAGFKNLMHIPNAIEISIYPYLERPTIRPNLLWVRSFSSIYNPLMALQVLQELQKTHPNATLTMVGPEKDESYAECLAFAKAQQLPVQFTGLLAKEAWLELATSHDIFINTTNFDNTPVSVIEAMALGLPVVSTNVGGIPYLIEDGTNGLLSAPEEVKAFAGCVLRLLTEARFAQNLAKNARQKVETFDWDSVKKRWDKVLS